jgi:hypothetical protein
VARYLRGRASRPLDTSATREVGAVELEMRGDKMALKAVVGLRDMRYGAIHRGKHLEGGSRVSVLLIHSVTRCLSRLNRRL